MNFLITAAGRGSRFLKEGIKTPKPLIKVNGNELLLWSLKSFNFNSEDRIYIVTLKGHYVKDKLESKLAFLYPNININWFEVDYIRNGQLNTALDAIKNFNLKGQLLIHNCDTFYSCDVNEIKYYLDREDVFGVIPCFQGDGNNWSFVRIKEDGSNLALEIKEKSRISNKCSVGSYAFSSSEELIMISEKYFNEEKINLAEYYIAPIYQFAINKSKNSYITKSKNVKLFGTPNELIKTFNISYNELLVENSGNDHPIATLINDST